MEPWQRHGPHNPCGVCDGHHDIPPGRDERDWGIDSADGERILCTREEYAGDLAYNEKAQGWWHRAAGPCGCGERHDGEAGPAYAAKPPVAPSPIVAEKRYDYTLPNGSVATHIREDRADGRKTFRWERDGKPGLRGYKVEDIPLFGAEELSDGAEVIVGEGETPAAALRAAGWSAVGTVTGAGGVPADHVLRVLQGHRVYLWADHDDVGRLHMERIGRRLRKLGIEVYVITWAEASEPGDDAADFLQGGGDVGALMASAATFIPTSTLPFKPVAQFLASVPTERDYVVEPYLAAGTLTVIHGEPKAGKTTLVHVGWVQAVLTGGTFLSKPVQAGPVVYLSEEGPFTLVEPLRSAGLTAHPNLHVLDWHEVADRSWADVAAEAVDWASAIGARLLVVDSLSQWAGFEDEKEQDSGAVLKALRPLTAGRQDGMAVLVIHHARKAGGSAVGAARGSGAITAGSDMVVYLSKPSGVRDTVRLVEAVGRVRVPPSLLLELKDDHYVVVKGGDASAAVGRATILALLPTTPDAAVLPKELVERVQRQATFIRERLEALVAEGHAGVVGAGRKGDPKRYYRLDDSAATKDETPAVETGGVSDE